MRMAVIFLLASLFLLAVALTGLQSARNKLAAANESIAGLMRDLKDSGQALAELKSSAARNERAQVVLRGQISAAHQLATRRNQTITRLLNENETLRRWYQSALPDDVARLHTRPEFATPNDYYAGCPRVSSCPIPASQPTTNGDLSDDIRQLEGALVSCALQVETVKQCQENHDVKTGQPQKSAL